jgi:hypothetical protein
MPWRCFSGVDIKFLKVLKGEAIEKSAEVMIYF